MPIYAIGGIVVVLAVLYFAGVFLGEGKDMMALCKADWEQFGLGIGAASHFAMGKRLHLVFSIGGDYFFDNTLTGHDTVYNPDDDNVNPTNDNQNNEREFTYADAEEAIKQPEIMPRIFVAILYNL